MRLEAGVAGDGDRRRTKMRGAVLAAFAGEVVLAALLRLYRLGSNGWSNTYYAAAVRSMLASPHNFLFAAFDPGGFLAVDKPPVALWIQTISARLIGFRPFAVVAPQALAGIAAVCLLFLLVRRHFGDLAGLLAALALAVTPVSVAVDRDNILDSWLVLVLLLVAWALLRACETGRFGALLLAAALVGVGFNVKMLAAWAILPACTLAYALGAPGPARRLLVRGLAAGAVVVLVSLSWPLAVDATDPGQRPWIDSTRTNSVLDLAFGYNGLGRVLGGFGNRARRAGVRRSDPAAADTPASQAVPEAAPGAQGPGAYGLGGGFGGQPGIGRLVSEPFAGQISWLFPLLAFGLLVPLARRERPRRGLRPALLALFGGWLLTYGALFSFSKGIIHAYYAVALAPPVAALAEISLAALWRVHHAPGWGAAALPGALAAAALWSLRLLSDAADSEAFLMCTVGACAAVAVAALLGLHGRGARAAPASALACALGMTAVFAGPFAWSLNPVFGPGRGADAAAIPEVVRAGRRGRPGDATRIEEEKLAAYLTGERCGERFLVASTSLQAVATLVIETGQPVMALGGFSGADPILTLKEFADLVRSKRVRFVLVGRGGFPGPRGADPPQKEIVAWVREHGMRVPPEAWGYATRGNRRRNANAGAIGSSSPSRGGGLRPSFDRGLELYDCGRALAEVTPGSSSG